MMRIGKAWFAFVAVAGALAVAVLLLLPRAVQREVDRQVAARLSVASRGAEQALALHSRRFLDVAVRAAADPALVEALDAASRGAGNLESLHRSAQERLRALGADAKAYQLLAVDARGRVLARAGADEDRWKEELSAAPVVAEALRGYRLDDTWDLAGRPYRVDAAPAIARDHYAGAVLILVDLGGDLLAQLHDQLGVEAALLERGEVAAHTSTGRIFEALPQLAAGPIREHGAALAERAPTEPIPLTLPGGARWAMVIVPLPGEASAHGSSLVLLEPRPRLHTLDALAGLLLAAPPSLAEAAPLVGGAAIGLAVVLLVGLVLLARAHDAPLAKLLSAAQAVTRGEVSRVEDGALPGRFGSLARVFNAALDRHARSVSPRPFSAEPTPPSAAYRAGAPPAELALPAAVADVPPNLPPPIAAASPFLPPGGSSPALPLLDSPNFVAPGAASAPAVPAFAPPAPSRTAFATPPPPFVPPPAAYAAPAPAATAFASPPPPAFAATTPAFAAAPPAYAATTPGSGAFQPPPPASAPAWGAPADDAAPAPFGGAPAGAAAGGALASLDEISGMRPVEAPMSRSAYRAVADDLVASAMSGAPVADGGGLVPGAYVPEGLPAGASQTGAAPDPLEEEFKGVFQDYLDTRQRCGEPTDGVTFEKFAAKLRANREQLIGRYACKRVKFQVYVKDGRAALKATPLSD